VNLSYAVGEQVRFGGPVHALAKGHVVFAG
jgi:hypothetical protein